MISFARVRVARRALATALCIGLLGVLPLAGVQAQEKPAAPPPATGGGNGAGTAQGSTITAGTYKIAPEDTLIITVVDRPELTRNIQVLSDGTIDMQDVGELSVVGKTIKDLKDEIQKKLARKYNRPQVNIAVAARQLRQANVFGAVANRGKIPLRDGWRIRDVIAQAGGLSSTLYPADRYEFFKAELNRAKDGTVLPIDLNKLLGQGEDTQNYSVEPEDTITIREIDVAEANVTVVGMVQKPGAQITPRSGNIVDVVVAAGPVPELALLSGVEVVRKSGEKTTLDLRGIDRPGFSSDFRVQPGDRITVPENKQRYYLLGNFAKPGEQVYPDDPAQRLTVYNVISKSGQLRGAEIKRTKLLRPTASGKAQEFIVDVEKMMKTGDFSKDIEIKPGDSVVVPDTPRSGWDRIWPVVQVLSIGLGLYLTIRAL